MRLRVGSATISLGVLLLTNGVAFAAPATHLSVVVPTPVVSYSNVQVSVTALDATNNVDTAYTGTVTITSSDPAFIAPAPLTLVAGFGTETGAALKTAGTQTVTATDTLTPSLNGSTSTLVVPGATVRFDLSPPANWAAGVPFTFTVTAADLFGNATPAYAGTVHFTSSDAAAVLPADSTLTNGVGTFSATFNTSPAQSITATDTVDPSITGTTGQISMPVRLQSFTVY